MAIRFALFLFLSYLGISAQKVNTSYIDQLSDQFTIRGFLGLRTNSFETNQFNSEGELDYRIALAPRIGAGFAYKWLNINTSLVKIYNPDKDKKGITDQFDFQWNWFFTALSADVRLQRHQGYYLQNSSDIIMWNEQNQDLYKRRDIITFSAGGTVRFYPNYKKYSIKSVFAQTQKQLKSAGSPEIAIRYNYLNLSSDSSIVPQNLKVNVDAFDFKTLTFRDIGIGLGYGYTYVYNDWYLNLSATGYLLSQEVGFSEGGTAPYQNDFQVNFQLKGALGYQTNEHTICLNVHADQIYTNWQSSHQILYEYSKIRLIYAYRFNLKEYIKQLKQKRNETKKSK